MSQTGVVVQVNSLSIRPAMSDGAQHGLNFGALNLRRRIKDKFSRYAAHDKKCKSETRNLSEKLKVLDTNFTD